MFGGNNNMYGGGGYDAMDTGGGFMKSPDKGGKSDAKKSRDKMNLVSLTIKQILKCESLDDSIRVDGVQLHTIKIIGTIESLEPHSTNSVYRVNDNTGTIECKQWMEKDPALAAKHDQCTVGRLVAIVGMVKDYESKKYIQIIAMRPVLDWNERTHHFLEATFLHLQNTRGPIPGTTAKQPDFNHSFGTPMPTDNRMGIQSSGSNFSGGMITVEGQVMMAHSNPEVTKVFGLILKQFQGVYDEQGLNKRDILSNMTRMGNNINHHIFQEAVKSLTDQGYLYSTLDEDTYACSISF